MFRVIVCLDVDYRELGAVASCVAFVDWADEHPAAEFVVRVDRVEPYEPGQFYKRELPCLLAVLEALPKFPGTIIIDGYVWLDDQDHPGLGAHLYESIGRRAAVIGVAKTRFLKAREAAEIQRGKSRSPLFITAAGIEPAEAARLIRSMHGPNRLPTLLKRVDRLCRQVLGDG